MRKGQLNPDVLRCSSVAEGRRGKRVGPKMFQGAMKAPAATLWTPCSVRMLVREKYGRP